MAEGILRKRSEELGIPLLVASAGISSYHVGENAHPLTVKIANENGVDIAQHKAQFFQVKFFDDYDWLLCMDNEHVDYLLRQARNLHDQSKIRLYRRDASIIADPYYGGEDDFREMYNRLLEDSSYWVTR
jgi:protein-tyrosine phosphatase